MQKERQLPPRGGPFPHQAKLSEPAKPGIPRHRRAIAGYSLAEVLVAVMVLGLMTVSLFAAFASGLALIQLARENLRATQILTQKMESVRLLTWSQLTDPDLAPPSFSEWYDPSSPHTGVLYQGTVTAAPAAADTPSDYRDNLRSVTVTVTWTNEVRGATNLLVRSRQMQTYVARFGLQNYFYQ